MRTMQRVGDTVHTSSLAVRLVLLVKSKLAKLSELVP
jgi:hypothetical protein